LIELDLDADPPPDLAVRWDINEFFRIGECRSKARPGIPELWCSIDVQYYLLKDDEYRGGTNQSDAILFVFPVIDMYLQRRLSIGESQAIREF
jgi:hypothetical protein